MSTASEPNIVPLSRFARRRERTRADLLDAAKRVLGSRGYHHTKISDIAAAADVGVGTFYLHYDSKEALFLELVQETTQRLKATLDAAQDRSEDPAERARLSCAEFFRFAQDNRETFRILFGEGIFNEAIGRAQAIFVADVAENFQAGVRGGVFTPYPPAVIAQALIGMLTQVVSWWITQDVVSLDEVVETTNRFIMSGLSLDTRRTDGGRT
jgi:AcrR family transcriptional regulator